MERITALMTEAVGFVRDEQFSNAEEAYAV
jgi:hypothetical protein